MSSSIRFASLGSGSEGNSLLVEVSEGHSTTRVLLDCGFSARETRRRIERLSLSVDDLDAILITHEHADHIGSALTLARKLSIPLYMSWGTARAVGADTASVDLHICESAHAFSVGGIDILPYTVPHDAREPLQYVFSSGASRLGVLTDTGGGTAHITETLSRCDALVLECNHDREMLAKSRYHAALKARIGGSHGHLANDTAAEILSTLQTDVLKHIVAAHLSRENNQAALAQAAIAEILNTSASEVLVATQDDGFDWLSI
jgi:phosphoribosyl 1,2-cyclic phosphodiesterase